MEIFAAPWKQEAHIQLLSIQFNHFFLCLPRRYFSFHMRFHAPPHLGHVLDQGAAPGPEGHPLNKQGVQHLVQVTDVVGSKGMPHPSVPKGADPTLLRIVRMGFMKCGGKICG